MTSFSVYGKEKRIVDAVIFDMDGVLVDTEPFYLARRQRFFESVGLSTDHLDWQLFIGGTMKTLWQEVLGEKAGTYDEGKLQQAYERYKWRHPLPYKALLFPDTRELLDFLKSSRVKIGLASSSTRADIQRCLTNCQLTVYFDVVLSGEDFPASKPNPAIYSKALEKLAVSADKTLVIEDSPKGIAAGKAAGCMVWAIKNKMISLQQEQADRIFENLHAVCSALQRG